MLPDVPDSPSRTVTNTFPAVFMREDTRSLRPLRNTEIFCRRDGEESAAGSFFSSDVFPDELNDVLLSSSDSESDVSSSEPYTQ